MPWYRITLNAKNYRRTYYDWYEKPLKREQREAAWRKYKITSQISGLVRRVSHLPRAIYAKKIADYQEQRKEATRMIKVLHGTNLKEG